MRACVGPWTNPIKVFDVLHQQMAEFTFYNENSSITVGCCRLSQYCVSSDHKNMIGHEMATWTEILEDIYCIL